MLTSLHIIVVTALQNTSTKDSNLSSSKTAGLLDEPGPPKRLSWLLAITEEDGLQVESVVEGSVSEADDVFLGVAVSKSPCSGCGCMGQGVEGGLLDPRRLFRVEIWLSGKPSVWSTTCVTFSR